MNLSQVLLLVVAVFISFSASQSEMDHAGMFVNGADISLSSPQITPAPLLPPAEFGTGVMCFYVSNENGSYAEDLLTLQIDLSNVVAINGVADISVSGNLAVSPWEWAYDASTGTFIGTQAGEIPTDYYEQVCIDVVVSGTSPQSNKDNGFHAEVLLGDGAFNGTTQNDEVEIYTYTQSSPCPDSLFVDGTISSLEFLAEQKIKSDAIVVPGGEVIFNAGECTILQSGFSVAENAMFEVKTDGCVDLPTFNSVKTTTQ